jgi:hypothetical protein
MKLLMTSMLLMVSVCFSFGQTKSLNTLIVRQSSHEKIIANSNLRFFNSNLTYVASNRGFKGMTFKKQAEKVYFTGPVFGPRPTLPYFLSSTR